MSTNPSAVLTGTASNPYQFPVSSYGAKGNGRLVTDGAMTSTQTTLTCATSTPFVSTDVGKSVLVQGAASAASATLVATITGFTSASQVTLSAAAGATVAGAYVVFGTDDTTAINSAVTAATTYALAHNYEAEIVFSSLLYMVAGTLTQGGATKGNAQIPLPFVAQSSQKLILKFTGLPDTPTVLYAVNSTPQVSGACLVSCCTTAGTNSGTFGPACVIGGYSHAQGAGNGVNSNIRPVITGLGIVVPYNGTYAGFDAYGCAGLVIRSLSVNAFASPAQMTNPPAGISVANRYTFGLQTPCIANDGNIVIDNYVATGMGIGIAVSEHVAASRGFTLYNYTGIQPYSDQNGSPMVHCSRLHYWCCEANNSQIAPFAGDPIIRLDIGTFDVDGGAGSSPFTINDPSSQIWGTILVRGSGNAYTFNGGMTRLKFYSGDQLPGIWGSPPAVPASTVAQQNLSGHDAIVYVNGGTLSAAVQVNGTTTGSQANQGYLVPSLATITLTYTVAPTWVWNLI
jgi:hypothetical protein